MLGHALHPKARFGARKAAKGVPMSACSQCGTVVKPGDKFCNVCGTPIRTNVSGAPGGVQPAGPTFGSPGAQPPPPPYGAQGPGGYGVPAPQARCQLGHEIPPGASYCAQGHPIALEQMQFANDAYGMGGGYGQPPQAPPMPGARPPGPPYGTPPPPGYGAPPQQPYNAPPPPAAYASAYGNPMPQTGPSIPPGPYPPPPAYGNQGQAQPSPGFTPEPPAKVLRGFLVAYGTNPSGDFWPLTGGRL